MSNGSSRGEASRRAWISAGAPILMLVLVVMLLACALVASFAHRQDVDFGRQSRLLVTSALDGRLRAMSNLTLDYSMWDEAFRAISRGDEAWVRDNYYTAVADGMVVFRADGSISFMWLADGLGAQAAGLAPAAVRAALRDMSLPQPESEQPSDLVAHTLIDHAGRLTVLAVAAVSPENAAARAGRTVEGASYLAVMDVLDPAELSEMGRGVDLDDLSYAVGKPPAGTVSLPLHASGGRAVGTLVWRDKKPGSAAFLGQLWPIVLSLLLIGALTVLIARRLAAAHVRSTAQAEAALESSRLKSEFIATMSHELRTPLNAIMGYAELIKEEAESAKEKTIAEDAERVVNAARHLRQLVNDILDQSRIEAGRLQLSIEHVPVAGVLADVVELAMPLARANGDTLVATQAEPGLAVLADDVRIRQCLLNLVANAAKYTVQGSIVITAKRQSGLSGDVIVFDIIDTGVGIAPDHLEHLFRPFAAQTAGKAGDGLGLSIAHKLARAMGGDITVRSELRKGSVFSLVLPAAPAKLLEAA